MGQALRPSGVAVLGHLPDKGYFPAAIGDKAFLRCLLSDGLPYPEASTTGVHR